MNNELTNKEKIISLYSFIKEFQKIKQKIIINDKNYHWNFKISDIPDDRENIDLCFNDAIVFNKDDDEVLENENHILKVRKPDFEKCPEPYEELNEWLLSGWNDFRSSLILKEKRFFKDEIELEIMPESNDGLDIVIEHFTDDDARVEKYEGWLNLRDLWVKKQFKIEKTRNFFEELHIKHVELQKESEVMELIIANGYIKDKNNLELNHPIITKRINIKLDAQNNTIYLLNTDVKTELYSELFQVMNDINGEALSSINADLLEHDYDPLDRNNTKDFFKTLIYKLSSDSNFVDEGEENYFGKKLSNVDPKDFSEYKIGIEKIKNIFAKKGKLNKLDMMINHDINKVMSEKLVNDKVISSVEDCDFLLEYIDLLGKRKILEELWNNLMTNTDFISFNDLDNYTPEKEAEKWIDSIKYFSNWYQSDFEVLKKLLTSLNFPINQIFKENEFDKDDVHISKIFDSITSYIPYLVKVCYYKLSIDESQGKIDESIVKLTDLLLNKSVICTKLTEVLESKNIEDYEINYKILAETYEKNNFLNKRNECLEKLENVAPTWAEHIKNRVGIHGNTTCPVEVLEAWKFKQYSQILGEMSKDSLEDLQKRSQKLGYDYRKITEKYAEKCAWYELLSATECNLDMKQALKGWELTVKKIGKGTGKNAYKYKEKARELMSKCQNAVPCWIMTINKAIESLKPGENKFDVIIIDEASQSDISALSIAYMGNKMIVVGDDRQVSPSAVGAEIDKINTLEKIYLKNKIPNAHLYTAKTSLYDIAATTFQPLMLKEHFRCVPEIIGFSNMLSYDYKIKPLRDSGSSNLEPAVINYRVNGNRVSKINEVEAKTIIAQIKACISFDEYSGKTFGIISLLGDEQVKLIQSIMFKYIDAKDIEERKILVGNASNFQGDERDVIFLSMVDSNNESEGPLSLSGNGIEDATKKRYNVAASRARDQLWVVNSLDASLDLKAGDIRKKLLDYASNPHAFEQLEQEIKKNSDSIFEEQVAKKLVSEGYHIKQQYEVGSYRLDIVVICENRKIVVECDGEKYHSGAIKVREDMERQTILERIGWKFIRIRGSQYFKNPEETMNRVMIELNNYQIFPEDINYTHENSNSELVEKIKIKTKEFLDLINKELEEDKIIDLTSTLSSSACDNDLSKVDRFSTSISTSTIPSNICDTSLNKIDKFLTLTLFRYMVLYSNGISRKNIANYYNVEYNTVKKSLQNIAEKYNVASIDDCVELFKKENSDTFKYKEILEGYNLLKIS